jgi:hypothetical protein
VSLSVVVLLRWYQGSVSLASIPPTVSWPGAPFPPRGPSGRFPRFPGNYEVLRLPIAHPAALRCLRLAVSRSHLQFAPLAARCAGRGPGVGHPVLPPGLTEKTTGPPRFLKNPRERALFSDPGGIAGARPLRRRDTAFR